MATTSSARGWLRRSFGFLWDSLDLARRAFVNLLFLGFIAILVIALLVGGPPRPADNTALVLNIRGDVVEQATGDAREAALAEAIGREPQETVLRDIVATLDAAARDRHIGRVVLALDDMGSAGLAKLREIAAAIDRFKASGKQVIAWGSSYDQARYLLAAHANEIYLHPAGTVYLRGFGGYRNYYRDAFDRLGVTVNVFKAGKYKSFAEPFSSNAPSKESLEADAAWLNDAWQGYLADIEGARKLAPGAITAALEALPQRVADVNGDLAQLAVKEKLVDGLKTRDELRTLLIERGARDAQTKSFRQIGLAAYRSLIPARLFGDAVGVIVAAGEISDDDAPPGKIGGRSTSELIRRAREDDNVKAIVLRVDSPGGSAFGSELIRRELELTRNAGKPVIVSMSDVAASGGFWISQAADEVLADPGTITGSIGVIAIVPTVDKALDRLSVRTGGVTTTWLGGAGDPRRPLDKRFGEVMQSSIGHTYGEFLRKVATARKRTPDEINDVAQGRVWTGNQAKARGLIDGFGGLQRALAAAGRRAQLADGFRVTYIEREPAGLMRLLNFVSGTVAQSMERAIDRVAAGYLERSGVDALAVSSGALRGPWASDAAKTAQQQLRWLHDGAQRPLQAYAHCFCGLLAY